MFNKEIVGMVDELRTILSSINGVKNINEGFSLSYVVLVEKEEDKESVEKVAETLVKQAEEHGFILEITPATKKDLDEAKNKLSGYIMGGAGTNPPTFRS